MTLRLPRDLWGVYRQPPQFRFGTVTSVSPGICTVQVAGGEIPAIYFKNAAPSVGDFVSVQRQSVVSYLMTAPAAGALWVGDSALDGIWRVPLTGQAPAFYGIPGTGVYGVVEGPDKAIWAATQGSASPYTGSVFRMVSSGTDIGQATSAVLANSAPTAICVGPDGNLWVADSNGGVWRVTLAFGSTFYALSGSYPTGIVTGPDNNLWVVDQNRGLWKVTTGGSAELFPLATPSPNDNLGSGPGGYLWAPGSSTTAGYVIRMATDGTATNIQIWPYQSDAVAAVDGPDGRAWVVAEWIYASATQPTSPLTGGTFAVSTDGVVEYYPFPTLAGQAPLAITVGADKRLWIADNSGAVWALTTSGAFTKYALGTGANPSSITAGP